MRGFTLVETIIYITLSSLIITSLFYLSSFLFDILPAINRDLSTESDGLTALKLLTQEIRSDTKIDKDKYVQAYGLENFSVSTSSTSLLYEISFSILGHQFSSSIYAP